jgi:hypothetical protein
MTPCPQADQSLAPALQKRAPHRSPHGCPHRCTLNISRNRGSDRGCWSARIRCGDWRLWTDRVALDHKELWSVYTAPLHIVRWGRCERVLVTGRPLLLGPAHRVLALPWAARRRRHGEKPTRLRRLLLHEKRRQALARPSASAPVTRRPGQVPAGRSHDPVTRLAASAGASRRLALRRLSQSARYRTDTVTLAHSAGDDKTQCRSYPPLDRPMERSPPNILFS